MNFDKMDDALVAELNKDLEQVFVDQKTNKAFRAPHFRQFSRIQNCKGKIHNLSTKHDFLLNVKFLYRKFTLEINFWNLIKI